MNATRQMLIQELQAIPWFQELAPDHFDRLVDLASLREVETGDVLYKEGDQQDNLYVVLAGRVASDIQVPGRGRVRLYTVEPMDVVGWCGITPVLRQRTSSAVAILPTRLAAFDALALRQACEADHDLGYVVMRRLANVVAARLLVTRLQLVDMFSQPAPEQVP
jgi:CRP/FNR family transcriptional regulator, cyclic AMP receptor protein